MRTEWSLEEIYKGLDDPLFAADVKAAKEAVKEAGSLLDSLQDAKEKERAEKLLLQQEKVVRPLTRLFQYVSLRQSVDTQNGDLMAWISRLQKINAEYTPLETAMNKQLAGICDIEKLAEESELVKAYRFLLNENKEKARYLLSDEVEEMVVSMNMTGGSAWEQLQGYLTSTVKVDYEGKTITLSEVRNLAYSPDLSFYNFPYAFGNLFALGLYGMFKKEGEGFVEKYKAMLKATLTCSAEEAGAMMGVDLTNPDFWRLGLAEIEKRVENFCKFS